MTERSSQITTQNPMRDAGYIRVPRDLNISIPSPDSDRVMAIRWADWKRLERSLTNALDPPKDYSTLYGVFFGLSGSAFLSLISLAIIKDLPAWVLPSYIGFALIPLACGILTVYFSRLLRGTRRTMITDLLEEVREIGKTFSPGPTQDGEIIDVPNREGA